MFVLVVHYVRLYLHIAAVLGMLDRIFHKLHDAAFCDELSGFKQTLHRCIIFNIYQPLYDLQGIFLDVGFRFGLGGVEEDLRYEHILRG